MSVEIDPSTQDARTNYFFLTSAVAPRPIAWVTSLGPDGHVNAAPFSWFQAVCAEPPMIMLAIADRPDGSPKDTTAHITATREFVVNISTEPLIEPMVASSGDYPSHVSEVEVLGLELAPSQAVAPPRLAASPVHLECRLHSVQKLGTKQNVNLILAEVVHMAADDDVVDDRGNVDPAKVPFLGRLGGSDYITVRDVFQHKRPAQEDLLRRE